MGKTFLAATINFDDLIKNSSDKINGYVLKNNEATLRKIYSFFQSDNRLLIVSGFTGTGKKQVCEHVLSYMDKENIVSRFTGADSSKLDDVELNFYKNLKNKVAVKDVSELDTISSIKDKIEYIISKFKFKYTFVLYNFDKITGDNREDILNYVYSLSAGENIKVVLVSRVFDTEVIPEEVTYSRVVIKALSKEIFENYLRDHGIKVTASMIEQLYRHTRGYFFFTCLAVKIMINQELTINNFIIQYSNSGQKFDEYLAQKYYSLIVGTTKSAFNLFVKLRHGLNIKALQKFGSFPDKVLKTLSENFYIYKIGELYYPSNFLKQHIINIAKEEISKEKLCAYYEKQIELSPDERDFVISRATMQEEIAFYKNIGVEPEEEKIPKIKEEPQITEPQPDKDVVNEYLNISVPDLFKKSKELFKSYDYLKTLDVLSVILSRKSELKDLELLHGAYRLLAETYTGLSKWRYALYYFKILEKYYFDTGNKENLELIKFETAKVYYQSYKMVDAIKQLRLLAAGTKNNYILTGCNILLGNIALAASNKDLALSYYKTGIAHIDANTEKSTALELFFKYAILSDEKNDINNAVEFYQKCIEINDGSSKYTALAYSNLADLFYDNELFEEAKDCFEKAYKSDKQNKNEYGMYYSLTKLVELTDKEEKDNRISMQREAKEHAMQSGDYHAQVDVTIKLGDLYFDYSDPDSALKEYLEIYKADRELFDEHNLKMLKSRMEDVKARLGKDKFDELVPDYE